MYWRSHRCKVRIIINDIFCSLSSMSLEVFGHSDGLEVVRVLTSSRFQRFSDSDDVSKVSKVKDQLVTPSRLPQSVQVCRGKRPKRPKGLMSWDGTLGVPKAIPTDPNSSVRKNSFQEEAFTPRDMVPTIQEHKVSKRQRSQFKPGCEKANFSKGKAKKGM